MRNPLIYGIAPVLLLTASGCAHSGPAPSGPAALTPRGYASVQIGVMPQAAGHGLTDDGTYDGACRIWLSERLPGLAVLAEDGIIQRISLYRSEHGPTPIRTDRGIGVGSTEQAVRAAYVPLRQEPHTYAAPPGKNLYWSDSNAGSSLRFEIGSDGRVIEVHAGTEPALHYEEGCS